MKLASRLTHRLMRGLRTLASARSFERYLAVLSACCAVAITAALSILARRAALRLDMAWDTFMYHIPFAALRGGLHATYEMSPLEAHRFEGFPPLPHLVEGLLWRMTGSMNAAGFANYIAFAAFLVYCRFKLGARSWLVAMISLTAPLVLIHTTVVYVDLFGNCFLAIGVGSFVRMFFFDESDDLSLLAFGLLGLIAAAWSKFQMAPLAAVFLAAFALLLLARRPRKNRKLGLSLGLVLAAAALAAAPYLKNMKLYGNPFWPVGISSAAANPPAAGSAKRPAAVEAAPLPYELDLRVAYKGERPPPLANLNSGALFLHSLLEINHPTSYDYRPRWVIDQGRAWLAFRMGGFWNVAVVADLLAIAAMGLLLDRRKGALLIAGGVLLLGLTAFLPKSHELRYYLFLPLCWAATIAMLFERLRRKYGRTTFFGLLGFAGLFAYMCRVNQVHYRIERQGYLDAANAFGASSWWARLKPGGRYCVVDMVPMAFLMTGPTMTEYKIIERTDPLLCPKGSVLIDNGIVEGPAGVALAAPEEAALEAQLMGLGLDLLYTKHDPAGAAARFRRVVQRNPNHFGAAFQLAKALDQTGAGSEVRPYWRKVLRMAESYHDQATAEAARARIKALAPAKARP